MNDDSPFYKIPERRPPPRYLSALGEQRIDPKDPERFRDRLLAFFKANRTASDALVAGNVQMLGFDEVRTRFADQWPGVRDKVMLLAEQVIRRHIAEHDVYFPVGEEQFVILFGRSSHAEADRKARAIASEISDKLAIAGLAGGCVTVRAVTFEVDRSDPERLLTPRAMASSVALAQRAAEQKENAAFAEARPRIGVSFWPIANIQKRLVSMYLLDAVLPAEREVDRPRGMGSFHCRLDCYVVEKASEALVDAAVDRTRALLVVPVHFDTLSAKAHREAFLEACRTLPRLSEKRALLLVTDLEDSVAQMRLHQLFTYVAPFFAGFVGRFGLQFRRADKLGGLSLVGLAVNGAPFVYPVPEHGRRLAAFAEHAAASRMRSFFLEAATFEAAMAAKRAGYDYVQGPGLSPAASRIGDVFLLR